MRERVVQCEEGVRDANADADAVPEKQKYGEARRGEARRKGVERSEQSETPPL